MNALRRDDIERARRTSPEERLELAFEMMEIGIDLLRDNLRRRHPSASEAEIDTLLKRRLLRRE